MCNNYKFKWKILKTFLDLHIIMAVLIEQFYEGIIALFDSEYFFKNCASAITPMFKSEHNKAPHTFLLLYATFFGLFCSFFVCVYNLRNGSICR